MCVCRFFNFNIPSTTRDHFRMRVRLWILMSSATPSHFRMRERENLNTLGKISWNRHRERHTDPPKKKRERKWKMLTERRAKRERERERNRRGTGKFGSTQAVDITLTWRLCSRWAGRRAGSPDCGPGRWPPCGCRWSWSSWGGPPLSARTPPAGWSSAWGPSAACCLTASGHPCACCRTSLSCWQLKDDS